MKENEAKGFLSQTSEFHRKVGSSGGGFEYLIEGEIKPNVPFGEQINNEALKKYYDLQLGSVRQGLSFPPEGRAMIMSIAKGFETDLVYLETRGFDVADARSAFEQLKRHKLEE